jgi:hypothetical protein
MKATILQGVAADIAQTIGVPKTSVTVTATASKGILTLEAKLEASSASQGVKIVNLLKTFDSSRRGTGATLGVQSLTQSPDARLDPKLPVSASTSSMGASFQVIDKATPFVVVITLALPYSVAQFDTTKQTSFKKSIAAVAGTTPENIVLSISEKKRRQSGTCVRGRARGKGRDAA